ELREDRAARGFVAEYGACDRDHNQQDRRERDDGVEREGRTTAWCVLRDEYLDGPSDERDHAGKPPTLRMRPGCRPRRSCSCRRHRDRSAKPSLPSIQTILRGFRLNGRGAGLAAGFERALKESEWYSWLASNQRPSDPQSDALAN